MGGSLVADLRPEQTFSMGESTWLKARCWLGPLPQRWIVIRKAECPRSTLLTKAWSPASPEEGGDVTAVHQQLATGLRPESTDRHGAGDFRYVVRYVRMGPHHQGLRPVHGSRVPGFAGKRAGMWAPYNQQLGNRLRRNRPIGTGRGLRYVIRYVGPGPHHHGFAPYTEAECPASPEKGRRCGRRTPTIGQPGSAPFGPKGGFAALRGALPGTKIFRTPT